MVTINKRSVVPPIYKRNPEKFKELNHQDLVPKSQISSAAIRDNYNLVLSNRHLSTQEFYGGLKDQISKFDIKTKGITQDSTRNKYIEPDNNNIVSQVPIFNSNKNSINLPILERNEYQVEYTNINNQNKVSTYDPCNITKPTIRQTLNNIEHTNINNNVNKVHVYNPNDITKQTTRQTLNNIEHTNINNNVNKVHVYDPNDITKQTTRQTLNNIEHTNINNNVNKVHVYDPNDITKQTTRQTLNNIEHKNINNNINQVPVYDPNDITKLTTRQTLNNIEHTNINNVINQVPVYDPNDVTKPTVRQTLNNIEYKNINNVMNQVPVYDPNDITKSTIRQTLNNIEYNNINNVTNQVPVYDPNDITKPTVRQTLNNIEYKNINNVTNQVPVYDPNDITKTTVRQTLSNIDYLNLVNRNPKIQTSLSDKLKITNKETLPNNKNLNIQTNKNNTMQLFDKARTTNKENINIDVLNKYSNITLNKKNIANLSEEAIVTLKQILDNISYNSIQNNYNKPITELQDIAKLTQQLPTFNNENISTFKNIKNTDIEILRNTIRELTNTELITAPCNTDKATTTYFSDNAKITNKETTLFEDNGNIQAIEGYFINTYETPEITLKQLLDYNDYISVIKNNNASYAHDPCDIAKITNKQDTISFNYDNHIHNPIYGGYQSETYDIQNTLKDITKVVDYINNPNIGNGNILKDNYLNMQLNRAKEEIAKNRDPTPLGNFKAPKSDDINIMIKDKPNINYIPPPRINNNIIDKRINMILTSIKNNSFFDNRLDSSIQESLKSNQIINNMVHKSLN